MAKNKHHATANPKPIAVSAAPVKKKFPLKKLLLAVVAVALVAIIVILCLPDTRDVPITEEQMAQISQDWLEEQHWRWYDEGALAGCRYYGEFEGYQIIFRPYSSLEPLDLTIAEQVFSYDTEFDLIACKDNTLTDLSDLYKGGYISQKTIVEIAAIHRGDANSWPKLDDAEKERIQNLWLQENVAMKWDSGEYQKCSTRYYGTYNGYVIFLNVTAVPPDSLSYYRFVIGNSTFELSCSASHYGYKDGKFFLLRELYSDGILNEKDVADIAKKHEQGV